MKLYKYLLLLLLFTSVVDAATIAQQWENSPKYKEYMQAIKAGDVEKAMKIKKTAINALTEVILQEYLADFKAKYRAKYLAIFQAYPLELKDITVQIHKKLRPHLIDTSIKGRNAFAKAIYNFIEHYNREDGKATKYAKKLFLKLQGSRGTPLEKLVLDMAKQSDIEAAKSPEQKQREYEEYIRKSKERQAELQRNIDANRKEIDANRKEIKKWNEIIKRLKSLGE